MVRQPRMAIELIDTHCHLDQAPLSSDVEAVLARARAAGVGQCITIGTTPEASRMTVELSKRHPGVAAAIGVHPHDALTVTDEVLADLEHLAQDPSVVAIGEVGLDFVRKGIAEVNTSG